jgi:predicted kinase
MKSTNDTDIPTPYLICGRIASGKSKLATELGCRDETVVIREDDWLSSLNGDEMKTITDYLRCTARLREVIGSYVAALLNVGVAVLLDFQANTVETRARMRGLLDRTGAARMLHVLDASEEVCLKRLRARNAASEHLFAVTETQFYQISRHIALPTPEEDFEV